MSASLVRNRPGVEVCVGSVADAVAAASAGADRLELCSATELGGLTPSLGLIDQVMQAVELPVIVMIRPRAGGFCYSAEEFKTAVRDAELALEQGIAGIAFGFLYADAQVDESRCLELVQLAGQRDAVFHRAFEFVPDAMQACEQLVEAGITRLLTSGQAVDALTGAPVIRSIYEQVKGQMEVMPGGGIRSHNASSVLQLTGCQQIHIGASVAACDDSLVRHQSIEFYSPEFLQQGRHRVVEEAGVVSVIKAIQDVRGHAAL